jgi:hypothetical protein
LPESLLYAHHGQAHPPRSQYLALSSDFRSDAVSP